MFGNAGKDVSPCTSRSLAQALGQLDAIAKQMAPENEWSVQTDAMTKVMALINGGALKYEQFVHDLARIGPALLDATQNLRSSLVKSSCLLLSHLARELGPRFDIMGEALFPLSNQTSNGTQIIAESCRFTILTICTHCQTKRVLGSILELSRLKSSSNRQISAEALCIILANWTSKGIIDSHSSKICDAIERLLRDANQETRGIARRATNLLFALYPDKKSEFMDSLDDRIRRKLDEELRESGTPEQLFQAPANVTPTQKRTISMKWKTPEIEELSPHASDHETPTASVGSPQLGTEID
jgi:hypothetical protein